MRRKNEAEEMRECGSEGERMREWSRGSEGEEERTVQNRRENEAENESEEETK